MRPPLALTGTPGSGKSAVAYRLAGRMPVEEVGADDRSRGSRAGRRRPPVTVDLDRLAARVRARPTGESGSIWVGHLAHFLPIRDVVVLRCHPRTLVDRLRRRTPGTPDRELAANFVAEAIDLVLEEALRLRRRVWEIDTTGRSVEAVTGEVQTRWQRRGPPAYGAVDWLGDPRVTDFLLGTPP